MSRYIARRSHPARSWRSVPRERLDLPTGLNPLRRRSGRDRHVGASVEIWTL